VTKTTPGVGVTSATATPLTVALTPTVSQPATSIEFTRGDLTRQHTEYAHQITPNSFPTPPAGTPASTDTEVAGWLLDWRTYVAVTRPEKNIDETKTPKVVVTSTTSSSNLVEQNGCVIFFRADNTRIAIPWDRSVLTVIPGTEPL
jgi:hypothetical protein